MKIEKIIRTILTWLPSLSISIFYFSNSLEKILKADNLNKVVNTPYIIITVGIVLFIATLLFLYNKTILLGTTILSFYMICIVFIHMSKGKPYEVTILIVLGTIFSAYLRKPSYFISDKNL